MDRKILKNSGWILIAQFIVKGLAFFYTLFLASRLGVENFGLYVVALAYFSLVASISDFGFNRFLVREGARDHSKLNEYLCCISLLRLTISCLFFAVFAVWLYLFDRDVQRVNLSLIAILAVLPQSIAMTFDSVLVAKQRFSLSALGLIVLSSVTTLLGIYFVHQGFNVNGAISALIIGELFYAAFLIWLVKLSGVKFLTAVSTIKIREIIKGSIPYGLLGILGLLYFRIDSILLSYLKGSYETGLYGVAYRFLEAIIFIPSAFATTLFPLLAKENNIDHLKEIYLKSVRFLAAVSVFIFLFYYFALPLFITYFLPEYLSAIPVIKILSLAIPFIFVHVPGATLLLATEKFLKPVIYLSILMLVINIGLNLIFIPQYGVIAAAIITVISELLSFVVFGIFILRKVINK